MVEAVQKEVETLKLYAVIAEELAKLQQAFASMEGQLAALQKLPNLKENAELKDKVTKLAVWKSAINKIEQHLNRTECVVDIEFYPIAALQQIIKVHNYVASMQTAV